MRKSFLNKYILAGSVLFVLFYSCKTAPSVPEIPDPLVLEAMYPPPPVEVVVEEVVEEALPVIPLYLQGRVMEVEVVQGVQSFLFLKFNEELVIGEIPELERDVTEEELLDLPESYGIDVSMKGEIYSDTQFEEKAGDFVVIEQYGEIFKARIETLNYIIDRSSLVQVQIR